MADPRIQQIVGYAWAGTIGYAGAKAGDLVYYDLVSDNNKWKKADSTPGIAGSGMPYNVSKYAQAIVTQSGPNISDPCVLCKEAYVVDTDAAPFNQGGKMLYLSATAGAYTETRPTTAGDLVQVVGVTVDAPNYGSSLTADKTQLAHLKIRDPYEQTMVVSPHNATGTAGVQLDSGDFIGPATDADDEDIGYAFAVPENAIDIEIVYLWHAAEATAGTPLFDMFVSAGKDGEQWDATAVDTGIADQAAEGAAADELQRTDVTAAFDTTTQNEPGEFVMVRVVGESASGSDTDVVVWGPLVVVFICV